MNAPQKLATGGRVCIDFHGILLSFNQPRRMLSTGICHGGIFLGRHAYNHRLTTWYTHEKDFPGGSVHSYLELMLIARGLSASDSSVLLTSARMDWHSYICLRYDDIIVECITTAGVEQTASRAGDPAFYHEGQAEYIPLGTINMMMTTNVSLPDGIMAKALITATEGKSAALQDAGIASLASGLPATGTGTDGFILACNPLGPLKTDAGAHSKLGELLAQAAYQTITDTFIRFPKPWNSFTELSTPNAVPAIKLKAEHEKYQQGKTASKSPSSTDA